MAIYNLPPLTNEKFADPDVTGVWEPSGRLDDMADSLVIAAEEVNIDGLKSLPDPWARPLLFSQALTTKGHVAANDARAQWRGLIALLALRNFFRDSYILQLVNYDLDDMSLGNPGFRRMLRQLMPHETISREADWSKMGVITFQATSEDVFATGEPKAIGMMVPNCLVAPARGARKIIHADIPWMREGLDDPIRCEGMSGDHWVALHNYLGKLFLHLNQPGLPEEAKFIRDQIKAFAEDCKARMAEASAAPYDLEYEAVTDVLPNSFYAPLNNIPKQPDISRGPKSQALLKLRTREDGQDLAKDIASGIILIDPDFADRTLGRPAQDIRIWGNYTLRDAETPNILAKIAEDAAREGYAVITSDALLTHKLTSINNDGRVDAHMKEWANFLLPISPAALLLLGRENLNNQLRLIDKGDAYEVQLDLDVIPGSPREPAMTHTVIRRYSKKDGMMSKGINEDLIFWPNISNADWPWTFMRYSFNPNYDMRPRFAVSGKSLAAMIEVRAKDSHSGGISLLRDLASPNDLVAERGDAFFAGDMGEIKDGDGNLIMHRTAFADLQTAVGEQHILGKGAEALFFAATSDEQGEQVPAGCILLPKNTRPTQQGELHVAVDFGTTNTVVYASAGRDAEPVNFANRVVKPFSHMGAENDVFALDCVEFFPAHEQESPFPTVMKRRKFDIQGASSVQRLASFPYHGMADMIFFMPETEQKLKETLKMMEGDNLVFQLKWDTDPKVRRMVKRFLRQLILMSSVEAMDKGYLPENIKWHFSYPQAWRNTQAHDFKSSATQAWKEIMGPICGPKAQAKDYLHFETEGAAALRYFINGAEHAGQAGSMVAMFDIGGGTTEIALFKDEQTIWRSSFRIAGGHFFTRFLANNHEIFDEMGDSEFGQAMDKYGAGKSMQDMVELQVSQTDFNAKFDQSYTMFSDTDIGKGLRYSAATALAGMFYYTGLVLRKCLSDGVISKQDVHDITVAFAGRGASFYRQLGDVQDADSYLGQLSAIISDVALVSSGDAESDNGWSPSSARLTGLFSSQPKHEVANGMLCDPLDISRTRVTNATPLGEYVTMVQDGTSTEMQSTAAIEKIDKDARLDMLGDAEFLNFIELLKLRLGLNIAVDSKNGVAKREIDNKARRELNRNLSDLARDLDDEDTEDTQEIEPPFISKLRALVEILSKPVEERKEMLVVKHGDPRW
ncbi:hypothetical protein [Sphingorhabdus sp. Alg239-R122]|uniref:hypothetical protein n=1 Tax=Sphingorhabdus sp. Alg239-R122 TaxID=2305989 RepID=UPI0013DD7767|nr:hypothetical protein [Sphingorhabdus sp. Alg239-R122]